METILQHWRMDTTTPVFLRIDGNVPHDGQIITHDFRLRRMIPTLDMLYQRGCPIILATHIDRPEGTYTPASSTAMIATWIAHNGYQVEHVPLSNHEDITAYMHHVKPQPRTITVIENTRFFHGEKGDDQAFIQELAKPASFYVNDAWGMMHRTDTSVYGLAQAFAPTHRGYGHLVAQELQALTPLRKDPKRPYITISGGAKVASKIPIIHEIVTHHQADTILVTPGIAGTFLAAQGYTIGQSLCKKEYIPQAQQIINLAQSKGITLDIPTDVYIVRASWEHELETVSVDAVPEDGIIIASGPETLNRYATYLNEAATIFLNGPMGDMQYFHTIQPFQKLLQMISQTNAYRVVGGGDSVAMIHTLAIDPFDFYSTGGGATLAYISGTKLQALDMLS